MITQKRLGLWAQGSKLNQKQKKTATEIRARNAREESILKNVASSIEQGYEQAIRYCALFEGDENAEVSIKLKDEFGDPKNE